MVDGVPSSAEPVFVIEKQVLKGGGGRWPTFTSRSPFFLPQKQNFNLFVIGAAPPFIEQNYNLLKIDN